MCKRKSRHSSELLIDKGDWIFILYWSINTLYFLLMWSNIKNFPIIPFNLGTSSIFFFFYTIQTTIRVPFYLDMVCHLFWSIIHLNAFVQACNLLVDLSMSHLLSSWLTTHSVISDPFVHALILQDILRMFSLYLRDLLLIRSFPPFF